MTRKQFKQAHALAKLQQECQHSDIWYGIGGTNIWWCPYCGGFSSAQSNGWHRPSVAKGLGKDNPYTIKAWVNRKLWKLWRLWLWVKWDAIDYAMPTLVALIMCSLFYTAWIMTYKPDWTWAGVLVWPLISICNIGLDEQEQVNL